ncbi:MAG: helical backbone metal receptor, partial [Kofleriaceae bacterium]
MRLHVVFAFAALASCKSSGSDGSAGSNGSAAPPRARIITLSPSATEVVDALGATGELVGVDDYSDFPASVKALPKVGSFMQPNLEAIVRLNPTVVVVDDIHSQTAGALRDAKVATRECAMHAIPDVKACLRELGGDLGRGHEAEAAIAAIDKAIEDAAANRPARHPKVLLVIDREAGGVGGIIAAGPGTFNDELLAIVGGDNVLAGAATRYPKIGGEEVLRAQPEIILDLSYAGHDSLAEWNALKIPAVATKHVISLKDPVLAHPTPRL